MKNAARIFAAAGSGLSEPHNLAIDAENNLYIADTGNAVIKKVSPQGGITIVAGNGGSMNYSGDGRPATSSQLYLPGGVASMPQGNSYIADTFNNRVRMVSPNGNITTIAGDGNAAYGHGGTYP